MAVEQWALGRLERRLDEASSNVNIAIASGRERQAGSQFSQAVDNWRHGADRIRESLKVASRLEGDAQTVAVRNIRPHVEELERIANHMVAVSLSDMDLTSSELQDASDQLDAIEMAQKELEFPTMPRSTWKDRLGRVSAKWHRPHS